MPQYFTRIFCEIIFFEKCFISEPLTSDYNISLVYSFLNVHYFR